MPQTGQPNNDSLLETLCEYYLPRVFQYVHYWVNDIETAEDISLKVLKNSIGKFEGLVSKTESATCKIFGLARRSVNHNNNPKNAVLTALSPEERDVISLKLGAELSDGSIADLLRVPKSKVGAMVISSLRKLEGANRN